MFGWEFPPHISGGLGTACFGLTQALAQNGIKLFFVVPKLLGKSTDANLNLLNASEIAIPFRDGSEKLIPVIETRVVKVKSEKPGTIFHAAKPADAFQETEPTVTMLEVPSSMLPYNDAHSEEKRESITRWNYVFDEPYKENVTDIQESEYTEEVTTYKKATGYRYSFTGSYGATLMEEVEEYSFTGAALSGRYEHDVIHVHDWMTYPAGIKAKEVSGRPLVIHVHATEYDRTGYCGGRVYEIEKAGMSAADKIVAVSQWTKDILIAHYGIASEKIEVVHNGIIASAENPLTRHSIRNSPVVTFLGRVTQQKGPSYFVEAAKKVTRNFPDAQFIVAGSGDLLPETIERVAALKMSANFHFTGFLTKEWIDKIWSLSSVYVMPSVSEPFGITPLEAVQAGVPVIVSKQSGVAEVMSHALKVNFWDTDELASSICSVLKYNSLSSMLKNKGVKEIKKLSWNAAALKLKKLYEELNA